jgi:EmrB/QacA subfamily drug resistance transporter
MEAAVTPDPKRWLALGIVAGGVALIIIDSTIVNVALPTIIRDLQLGLSGAEWVNSIYSLVFAALLIATGRFADLRGRRLVYIAGLAIFAGASILAGMAGSGELLILARLLQGVGGALVLPATLSIVNATFQGKERAAAFGVWGGTIGGMAALGPILGGWLTTSFGWRWIFLINIPLAAILIVLSLKYVRETRDPNAQPTGDAVGAISIGLGLAALVFALIEGRTYGWWAPLETFSPFGWDWPSTSISVIPLALALSVGCVVVFLVNARLRRRADRPRFVDLELFRLRSFGFGNLTALLVSLGEFGLLFAIPLYLQNVLGMTATESGLIIACLALGAFASAGLAAPVSRRLGGRGVVQLGMALEAIGLAAFALVIEPSTPALHIIPTLFVYGLGVGFATAQLTGVILADVPIAASGQASGIQSTSRQIGSALGVAVLGVILASVVYGQTSQNLQDIGTPPAKAAELATLMERSAGTALPEVIAAPGGEALAQPLEQAFSDATRYTGFAAALFILIGLGSSLLLPKPTREL